MIYYKEPQLDEDRIKMCNCAKCKQELLGVSMMGERIPTKYKRPFVFGTLAGRPYCYRCFNHCRKDYTNSEIHVHEDVDTHKSFRRK